MDVKVRYKLYQFVGI